MSCNKSKGLLRFDEPNGFVDTFVNSLLHGNYFYKLLPTFSEHSVLFYFILVFFHGAIRRFPVNERIILTYIGTRNWLTFI